VGCSNEPSISGGRGYGRGGLKCTDCALAAGAERAFARNDENGPEDGGQGPAMCERAGVRGNDDSCRALCKKPVVYDTGGRMGADGGWGGR
jgi:hypothetical protein